ncbi:hypothetical protein F5884DRAFT_849129 [Xylogone sp. PMI_703]|nr:hypothetical protein F5884DRAFT_849129 [Xylogone sp. PMI_703]
MTPIKTVALAGASGALGSYALKALLRENFEVTVLTRSQKSAAYDPSVKVVEVDYTSRESLTSALRGQDAVVSAVTGEAVEGQIPLIDAAIATGVKRFIPSEYGTCTTSPKVQELPVYSSLAKIRQYLIQKSKEGAITYSVLACGAFLEYYLKIQLTTDSANRKVDLIDGGDNRVSATPLDSVGQAIAGILKNLDKTENRTVFVSQVILTQNQVLEIAREVKPEIKWNTSTVLSKNLLQEALSEFASGEVGQQTVLKLLVSTAFGGEEYGSAYDKTDNSLFGIETLGRDDIKKRIAELLK